MNADLIGLFLKNAIQNAMKDGGNTLVQELAEALNPEQLDYLIKTLAKVRDKKRGTINAR